MRLLFCSSCEDIITLRENMVQTCQCGKVSGSIVNDQTQCNIPNTLSYTVSALKFRSLLVNEIDTNIKPLNQRFVEEDRLFCVKVLEYLNHKAGTDYKTKFPSTAATAILLRKKELDLILDDFYKVIDKKCKDWLGSTYEKFLRPMTLFNKTKFENYIGELHGKEQGDTTGRIIGQFASTVQAAKK